MNYLILVLACWRISALFAYECGPWDIFKKFREGVGIVHSPGSCEPLQGNYNFLGRLIECVWCSSIYFAIIGYAFYLNWPGETLIVLSPFAISAGAILLEEQIRG
ncbi:unnamed protein product [marine sediment metagenome]|uniref:DUF1360 domain-containing protein n=1 Tax=marine sediment metagenome TaxID=412755 RepID=X1BJS9_9ZZZZ